MKNNKTAVLAVTANLNSTYQIPNTKYFYSTSVLSKCPVVKTRRAMTLVEILAVVVILGLIAGTLFINLAPKIGMAKHELAKSGIAVITSNLELYQLQHSEWPGNDSGLALLSEGNATPADTYYLGPDKLMDPWNNPYLYLTPGPDGHPYEVISYGADGQPGGDADNADISSVNLSRKDQ